MRVVTVLASDEKLLLQTWYMERSGTKICFLIPRNDKNKSYLMEHVACELCREAKATVIKRFLKLLVFFPVFF